MAAAMPEGELNLTFPNSRGKVHGYSDVIEQAYAPILVAAGLAQHTASTACTRSSRLRFVVDRAGLQPEAHSSADGHSSIAVTYDITATCSKTVMPTRAPRHACSKRCSAAETTPRLHHERCKLLISLA